jgi:group I intron endonuclease
MHIYKFTHLVSGRCYIGQTTQDPNRRRLEHISDSRYTTKEYHFHNALRKYGVDSFVFEVIDSANSLEELNLLEEKYVVQYDSINNGFNIRQAGGNKLHSEESKQRMSEAQKAAHDRRRTQAGGVEKTRPHKKHTFTGPGCNLGIKKKEAFSKGTKSWKLENGLRVWYQKEAVV